MGVHQLAITWNDRKARIAGAFLAAVLLLPLVGVAPQRLPQAELVGIIVRELPGAGRSPERLVRSIDGEVERHIGIIRGFVARVPRSRISEVEEARGVWSVTLDRRVHLSDTTDGFDADHDSGSMFSVAEEIGAGEFWNDGYTGEGVGVALIDSGVVPVDGLTIPDRVINGPDLSFESQVNELRHLDTFGHGTHMAGIIAGRDTGVRFPVQKGDPDHFLGVAPDARIINLKVADAYGAVDVSQVIAAIDWVVQHRNDEGLNIRVLNLSFGTDGVQSYLLDPLAYAVEVAWQRGIVVVVAGGNRGFGTAALNNPAFDPFVIAVGAAVADGDYDTKGDSIPDWSSRGDATRHPDLVAPGQSIVSLRSPGSFIDSTNPQGRVGSRFFRGSGTSQAAAAVSGAAALVIEQRPGITPDQVKRLLSSTASPIPGATAAAQGAGMLDLKEARETRTPSAIIATQLWPRATGLGSLDLARGSAHVADGTTVLSGERDIFGGLWDGKAWSTLSLQGKTWSGGVWLGKTWSGSCWCGISWSGKTWSSATWSGTTWSGKTWSGFSWAGKTWSAGSWSGEAWAGKTWSGKTWTGDVWASSSWG